MRIQAPNTRIPEGQALDAVRASGRDWEQHREGAEELATLASEANGTVLNRDRLNREGDEQECLAALPQTPATSPSALKVKLLGALALLGATILLIWAGYELALQSLSLLGGHNDSPRVLAVVLAGAAVVAFELFMQQMRHVLSHRAFRIVLMSMAIVPVVCLLAAAVVMSLVRADYSSMQRALELRDNPVVVVEGAGPQAEPQQADQSSIEMYHSRTRMMTMLLVMLAAVGLEFTAALALHHAVSRLRPSLILLGERRRLKQLREQIAHCAFLKYRWEQYPRMAREAFTRAAKLELARQRRRRLIMLIAGALFLAVFLLSALTSAAANELVIVALDLSTSSAGNELADNIRAVERIIHQFPPGRLVIIPINAQSFASPPLLDARLSSDTGTFGERSKAGRRRLAHVWAERSKALQGNATASDIFAALLKAAVLREESRASNVDVIVFSDMRHYDSRGYRFEGQMRPDVRVLARVEREGLIPRLSGVQVWALGAHAAGIPDSYWLSLREFWRGYFAKSGAALKGFSAERRWNRD